ncbi:MAG: putative lipid II flippase FtsW [bacterium]|nr:putative lipid II flippase FtsW [bacterium]
MARKGISKLFDYSIFKGSQEKPDMMFVGLFLVILTFGMLVLSSASAFVSYQWYGNTTYFVVHQLLYGVLPGLALMYIVSKIDYHIWKKLAFPLFVATILLLIAVFIPGLGLAKNGAHRWIHIGTFTLQPSEIAKLTFLLYLATWFSNKGIEKLKDFAYGFLPFLALLLTMSGLIILQPDMGTMGVIVMMSFIMLFTAGARIQHLLFAFFGGLGFVALLVKFEPYRANRLTAYLNPELDIHGVGYHVYQALVAVGSGGFLGRGFGHSRQKFDYLPAPFTDSIFAIISEEMGFFGANALIILLLVFTFRGLTIARHAPDYFGKLLVTGVISWFILQSFVNIGAMLKLIPLTGIPLPFISYGGSALLVSMCAMGIVINVSRQTIRVKN